MKTYLFKGSLYNVMLCGTVRTSHDNPDGWRNGRPINPDYCLWIASPEDGLGESIIFETDSPSAPILEATPEQLLLLELWQAETISGEGLRSIEIALDKGAVYGASIARHMPTCPDAVDQVIDLFDSLPDEKVAVRSFVWI